MRTVAMVCLAFALCGCKAAPPTQQVSVSVHGPGVPLELHWYRNSAERRALYAQVYALAGETVPTLAKGLPDNSWGVILDVDETILDNSEYMARLSITGQEFSPATWTAWTRDRRAVALPGAAAFIHAVRSNDHGRVVLVTNRLVAECPDTEVNLHEQGIEYDAILCAPNGPDGKPVFDKNPRFALVKSGGVASLGRLNVLAYFGDNIQDFPDLTQANFGDASHFGKDYFVFPNPMYGSWVGNVYR